MSRDLHDRGACASQDPALFFPETEQHAKTICAG